METTNNRYRSRVRKSTWKLFYWTVAWLLAIAMLAFGPKFLWQEAGMVTVMAFVIALVVGIGMVIVNKNHLRDLDELEQKVMLEAMGITLGVPLIIGIPYSLLVAYDVAPVEDWFAGLIVLMGLTYIVSVIAGKRRFK